MPRGIPGPGADVRRPTRALADAAGRTARTLSAEARRLGEAARTDGAPDALLESAVRLLSDAGAATTVVEGDGHAGAAVEAEVPGPAGAPTVLLYAADYTGTDSAQLPWRTTGTRAGDLVVHAGALRALDGKPPVGIRVVFDVVPGGPDVLPPAAPSRQAPVSADAALLPVRAESSRPAPYLVVSMRGVAVVDLEVTTLRDPADGASFAGAAPDAFLVLATCVDRLLDERGSLAVPGLAVAEDSTTPASGAGQVSGAEFRRAAGVLSDVPLMGTGPLGARLHTTSALSVAGVDVPASASGAVVPHASARLVLRLAPNQGPAAAQAAVQNHLRALRPFGVPVAVLPGPAVPGFRASTGAAHVAAATAMRRAWGTRRIAEVAASGSDAALASIASACPPGCEVVAWHLWDGRPPADTLGRAILAEAAFLQDFRDQPSGSRPPSPSRGSGSPRRRRDPRRR